jgi:hypothetical protein
MQAADVEVGTDPVDQLVAVFHRPEVAAFQLSVQVICGRTRAMELTTERAARWAALPRASFPARSTGLAV